LQAGNRKGSAHVSEEKLLTAGKIAEAIGVSQGKVSKYIRDQSIEPDETKGRCGYFGAEKVRLIEKALKAK
jgi:predicted transcriptional regulator